MLTPGNATSNIFVQFIKLLGVKHTESYASRYYNEHPYKNTLFGLSRMLWTYGIENVGLRLRDKKEIYSLEPPFIAQLNQDFAIVRQLEQDKIRYLSRGKEMAVTPEEFYRAWSGVVLLAETDKNAAEPGYTANRKKDRLDRLESYLLPAALLLIMAISYISSGTYAGRITNILLLLNLSGCYISYLLVLKQLHIQSDSADRLCSLLHQSDCNHILDSPAAKFMGLIGWSEIGLGYFLSNMCILVFMPRLIPYLILVNICALPYSFWSVWYQKVKAKSWCTLCLLVQALLWGIFLTAWLSGRILRPAFTPLEIAGTGCIYLLPLLAVRTSLPLFTAAQKNGELSQEINSLRMQKDVFACLLKQRSYYPSDKSVSQILFGNPEAGLQITILTNPHCEPCGRMHTRVKKVLESIGGQVCIQYVFTSFNQEVESSARELIAIYLNANKETREKAFDEWFAKGKYDRNDFFKQYPYDKDSPEVTEEYRKHTEWKQKYALNFTPLVFINGYEMPPGYKIEDMICFPDLEM